MIVEKIKERVFIDLRSKVRIAKNTEMSLSGETSEIHRVDMLFIICGRQLCKVLASCRQSLGRLTCNKPE